MADFTLRLPDNVDGKVKAIAKYKGLTKNAYIVMVLSERVKRDLKILKGEEH